jgi:hypothetical protein
MTAHDPTPASTPEPASGSARSRDLAAMQRALEEGLQAIAAARTAAEADAARDRARARLEALGFRAARVDDA